MTLFRIALSLQHTYCTYSSKRRSEVHKLNSLFSSRIRETGKYKPTRGANEPPRTLNSDMSRLTQLGLLSGDSYSTRPIGRSIFRLAESLSYQILSSYSISIIIILFI